MRDKYACASCRKLSTESSLEDMASYGGIDRTDIVQNEASRT